ncbi:hypothetical protein ACHQM5_004832 [Ranunculus cassubicifolius]
MDWGRKHSSSISQVFHLSWFSKVKKMAKRKRKTKPPSPRNHYVVEDYDENESYWKLSFRGGDSESRYNHNGGMYDLSSDDDELDFPFSTSDSRASTREYGVEEEDSQKFTDMVSNVRNLRGLNRENREETPLQTPRRRIQKGRKSIKLDRRILEEISSSYARESSDVNGDLEIREAIRELEKEFKYSKASGVKKSQYISSPHLNHIEPILGFEKLKIVEEDEKQRKPVSVNSEVQKRNRVKQSCKVKVQSPRRTPPRGEFCKIKALEDMKKARKKTRPPLESLAVKKNSFDPQKDFKDSMMEIIVERGIRKPEELENLLACYLSLNSDEYHDHIVKAFRQVWLDLYHLSSEN